jgi:hypothetical protein
MKTGVSTSPRLVCRMPALALLEESVLRRVNGEGWLTGKMRKGCQAEDLSVKMSKGNERVG